MKQQYFKGKPIDDASSRVCVLFEPRSGRIFHIHGITLLHGARNVTEKQVEEQAFKHAKAFGRDVSALKPLHVPIGALREGGPFKVNDAGTALIKLAAKLRPTHASRLQGPR